MSEIAALRKQLAAAHKNIKDLCDALEKAADDLESVDGEGKDIDEYNNLVKKIRFGAKKINWKPHLPITMPEVADE